MFKMERYKKEESKEDFDDIRKIRTSFLDSNIINLIKNQKMKDNSEFLNNKRIFADVPLDKLKFKETDKTINNDNPLVNKLNLEDFEKIVFAKIKN